MDCSEQRKSLNALWNFLQTKSTGVFLDELCHDFHEETKRKISFCDFGFGDLTSFINSIPKIARLEYSDEDKRMKVFGITPKKRPKDWRDANRFRNANRDQDEAVGLGIMGAPGSNPQGRPGLLPIGQDVRLGGHPKSAGGAPGILGPPGPPGPTGPPCGFMPDCPVLPGDHNGKMNDMNCRLPPRGGRGGPGLLGPPGSFMPDRPDFPMDNDFLMDNPNFGPPRGCGHGMMGPPGRFMPDGPGFPEDPSFHVDWCPPVGRGRPGMMGPSGPFMPDHPSIPEGHYVQIGSPYCRTVNDLDFIPDIRGVFSLRFPARNKASIKGHRNLPSFLGLAGHVAEINETRKWIFVGYSEPVAVTRALKMFPQLGLSVYGLSKHDRPQSRMDSCEQDEQRPRQMKRTRLRSKAEIEKRLKDKKRKRDNSYRMYVGNLDPNGSYSFDKFRSLFKGYRLEGVRMKRVEKDDEVKLFAYVLIPTKEKAIELCNKFNGYVWMGKPLVMEVKEKKQQQNTAKEENADSPGCSDTATNSSLPDLTDTSQCESTDMPSAGLEPDTPGSEPFPSGSQATPSQSEFSERQDPDSVQSELSS